MFEFYHFLIPALFAFLGTLWIHPKVLKIALLKSRAHKVYVGELSGDYERIKIAMYPRARINPSKIPDFMNMHKNRMTFITEMWLSNRINVEVR